MNETNLLRTISTWIVGMTAFLFLVGWTESTSATPALRRELSSVAEAAKGVLDDRAVAIGPFTGPSTLETAGPGIQRMLAEELEKIGVPVKRRAEIIIKGSYSAEKSEEGLELQLKFELVDALGKTLVQINSDKVKGVPVHQGTIQTVVKDERTAISFLQPTSHIPSDLPSGDRANLVRNSLAGKEDPPHIAGNAVFAKTSSPYGLEVIVEGTPRKPRIEDGMAFVDIKRGEEYEVRLINKTPYRAAVRLMIDGLNSFTFSEVKVKEGPRKGQPAYDHWILAPHSDKTNNIQGWHKRNTGQGNFIGFKVTSYADSAAGQLGHKQDLGTITAVFCAAWEHGKDPPKELKEPPHKDKGLVDSTGFGKPKSRDVKPVKVEIGVVRAVVSIRYSRPQ